MKFCFALFGRLLVWTPNIILIPITAVLAWIPYRLLPSRNRILLSNFRKAFPELSERKHSELAKKSCRRTVEQGLLSIAWPFLSDQELIDRFPVSEKDKRILIQGASEGRATLWLIPHFCHAEATALLPKLIPEMAIVATLVRQLKNRILDDHLKQSRERFGLTTFGRENGGILKASRYLRDGKVCALLFDQNAGHAGTRMQFMGRECSCTTLPDIFAAKFNPLIIMVYSKRTGFWRSQIKTEILDANPKRESVAEKANLWLEVKLRTDENLCVSWLWLHSRWRKGAKPPKKLPSEDCKPLPER